MNPGRVQLRLDRLAVIVTGDGVITDTARLHAAAWKRVLDEYLRRRSRRLGLPLEPFEIREDYLRYLDGRSGLDGVREFLQARGVALSTDPAGEPDSVADLAARKTAYFRHELDRFGVAAFSSSVGVLRELRRRGVRLAVVSADSGCERVLDAAHVRDMVDACVDAADAARLGLPGGPDPAILLEAAERLGGSAATCGVIDDTTTGVDAARQGGFHVVIGVDRHGDRAAELSRRGAHIVVRDLTELDLRGRHPPGLLSSRSGWG